MRTVVLVCAMAMEVVVKETVVLTYLANVVNQIYLMETAAGKLIVIILMFAAVFVRVPTLNAVFQEFNVPVRFF